MSMLPARLFADLIGRPYIREASGPDAYGCAGLAIEMQRRQGRLIHGMPDDVPAEGLGEHLAMRRILRGRWTRIVSPEPGCLVFFPADPHVGTMIDRRRLLHCTEQMGQTYIESLDSPALASKRRYFYLPEAERAADPL